MSQDLLPSPHQVRTSYDERDHLSYTIGDIPELVAPLNDLYKQLLAIESQADQPDGQVEFEILPIAEGEAREALGLDGEAEDESVTVRNIHFLFELRDQWVEKNGEGSEVVAWKDKSREQDRPDHKKRWFDYLMVILKDKDGNVEAMVADTLEERNALYMWRADASDVHNWEEVFSQGKQEARDDAQARRFYHRGDIGKRVLDYLAMDQDKYLDEITRQPRSR